MNTAIYNEPWKTDLFNLIQRARTERKWLYHGGLSGPIWLSPDRLEQYHKEGRFMWGTVNWLLRDPREYLDEADEKVRAAIAERDRRAARISDAEE